MKKNGLNVTLTGMLLLSGCHGGSESVSEPIVVINYPSGGSASLQDAIDSVPAGGYVNIEPGIYTETVTISDKVVHLTGEAGMSVIDGQSATCITVTNASGTSITGLSIVNCEDGILANSFVDITGNIFINNVDGIDYERGSGGTLVMNVFQSHRDDAIDLDREVAVEIEDNVISDSADDGIEIRLHPYEGDDLAVSIKNNTFTSNQSNGIQFIDYETATSRSYVISGNTFIGSGYNEISFSDNQNTLPSYDIGEISESVLIEDNVFYPSVYTFSGAGDSTEFIGNIVYSSTGDGNLNTTNDFTSGSNIFVRTDP